MRTLSSMTVASIIAKRPALVGTVVLVILGLWIVVKEAERTEAEARAGRSRANTPVAAFTADSARACSDSAVLAQRRLEDAVSYRVIADMQEPLIPRNDSSYLTWRRRRARIDAGESRFLIYTGTYSCADYEQH